MPPERPDCREEPGALLRRACLLALCCPFTLGRFREEGSFLWLRLFISNAPEVSYCLEVLYRSFIGSAPRLLRCGSPVAHRRITVPGVIGCTRHNQWGQVPPGTSSPKAITQRGIRASHVTENHILEMSRRNRLQSMQCLHGGGICVSHSMLREKSGEMVHDCWIKARQPSGNGIDLLLII